VEKIRLRTPLQQRCARARVQDLTPAFFNRSGFFRLE